jgi:predicted MFS family arabinose efflux permease
MFSGIIVTFTSWRVILGVQGGMTLIGLVLAFFFVPRVSQLATAKPKPKPRTKKEMLEAFNPMAVIRQWRYPSILLAVCRKAKPDLQVSSRLTRSL